MYTRSRVCGKTDIFHAGVFFIHTKILAKVEIWENSVFMSACVQGENRVLGSRTPQYATENALTSSVRPLFRLYAVYLLRVHVDEHFSENNLVWMML